MSNERKTRYLEHEYYSYPIEIYSELNDLNPDMTFEAVRTLWKGKKYSKEQLRNIALLMLRLLEEKENNSPVFIS